MRFLGALVLLVVLTAAVAIKVCSNRDIRLMVGKVCNLSRHRRALSALLFNSGAPVLLADKRYRRQILPEHSSGSWQPEGGAINDITQDAENGISGINMNRNTGLAARRKRRETVGDVVKRCCKVDCDITEFLGACS